MNIKIEHQQKYRVDYFELIEGTQYLKSIIVNLPNTYENDDINWLDAIRSLGVRANRVYQTQLLH